MKIQLHYDRKRYIWIGIMALFGLLMFIWSHYPVAALPGFIAAYALIAGLDIRISDSTPGWWQKLASTKAAQRMRFPAKMTGTHSNMLAWVFSVVLLWFGPRFSV